MSCDVLSHILEILKEQCTTCKYKYEYVTLMKPCHMWFSPRAMLHLTKYGLKSHKKTKTLKRNSVLYLFFLRDIKRTPIHIPTRKHFSHDLFFTPHIPSTTTKMFSLHPYPTQLLRSLLLNSLFLNSFLCASTQLF